MIRRSTDISMNKFSFKGMSIALGIHDIFKPTHKILHQILHKIDLIKPGAVIVDYGCGPGNCTIAASAELVSPPGKVYA
jgi:precorrin-6B methylase 2